MIIWSRKGWIVGVIALVALVLGQVVSGGQTADELSTVGLVAFRFLPLLVAGVACWFVGTKLNQAQQGNNFFFIPMQFWGAILPVLGLVMVFA